ncbi:MAG: DUF559 domain-containing protein [Acidimicrobiia bacterium]
MATDLDRRVEELASRQLNHFSVQQVLLLNGNRDDVKHRVATGRWQHSRRGVLRLLGAPETFDARVVATLLAAPEAAAASHRCAAAVFGVPGFGHFFEITIADELMTRIEGVAVHRSNYLPEHHVRVIRGIRTTSIARTLVDLSAVVRPNRLERAMDNCIARGMVTIPAIATVNQQMAVRGRRKVTVIRRLLAERAGAYVPPATELEAAFAGLISEFDLPAADRQVNLGDGDQWVGRVDFLFRGAGIIVEVDGSESHSSLLDRSADAERDRMFGTTGWRVMRFGWSEVTAERERVASEVRVALRARR